MKDPQCDKCDNKKLVFIEYHHSVPQHHDGWSEIYCPQCGYRKGRWSGKELQNGELEERFGATL